MRRIIGIIITILLSAMFSGCTGESEPFVMRVGSQKVSVPEFRFYFLLSQMAYENEGGTDIWLTTINGVKAEEVAKDRTFESIARIKISNIEASSLGIELTSEDRQKASEMVMYYQSLIGQQDLEEIGMSLELMQTIMEETIIYGRVFEEITKNVKISEKDFMIFFENYIKDPANGVQMEDDLIELKEQLREQYTEKVKNDVFNEQYSKWEANTEIEKNQEVWDTIHILSR